MLIMEVFHEIVPELPDSHISKLLSTADSSCLTKFAVWSNCITICFIDLYSYQLVRFFKRYSDWTLMLPLVEPDGTYILCVFTLEPFSENRERWFKVVVLFVLWINFAKLWFSMPLWCGINKVSLKDLLALCDVQVKMCFFLRENVCVCIWILFFPVLVFITMRTSNVMEVVTVWICIFQLLDIHKHRENSIKHCLEEKSKNINNLRSKLEKNQDDFNVQKELRSQQNSVSH